MWGSRDPFLGYWDPLSRGRLKLETSDLAQRGTAVSTNEKCKIRSKGSCGCHVTHFCNFGTPIEAMNFKFGIELDDGLY